MDGSPCNRPTGVNKHTGITFSFDERLIMIIGGIIPMIVGRLVFFPIPGVDPPKTPWGENLTEPLIPYNESAAALHFAPHHSPLAVGQECLQAQ